MSRSIFFVLLSYALAAPALSLGTISVSSDVPAYVELRGEKVGETPLSVRELDRGSYEVTVTALASGETKVFRVSIPAGGDVVRAVSARFEGSGAGAPREPVPEAYEKPRVRRVKVAKPRQKKPRPPARAPAKAADVEPEPAGLAVNAEPVRKLLSIRQARRRVAVWTAAPPVAPPPRVEPSRREPQNDQAELDRLKRHWRDPYVKRHVIAGGAALIGAAASSGILAGIGLGGVIMNEVIHREDQERTRRL